MSLLPPAPPHLLASIPGGVDGVRATLKLMCRLTREARQDPAIKTLADTIVAPLPSGDFRAQRDALFFWVKRHIKYVRDIRDVETLSTPERTLRVGTGDCDDMAVLLASLFEAVGNRTRFKALGFKGGNYEHVVAQAQAKTRSGWLTYDPTVPYAVPGWHPPDATRYMLAHV